MNFDKLRIHNMIIHIVKKIANNSQEVTLKSHLYNDLGFTSTSSIELKVEIEQIYEVDIMEELSNGEIQNVEDLINHVCK